MTNDMQQNKVNPCENCSLYFWGTILTLCALTIYVQVFIDKGQNGNNPKDGPVIKLPKDWDSSLDKYQRKKLEDLERKVGKKIDEHINKAFEPVYEQISKYADFHYSLVGEYTELGQLLLTRTASKKIKEVLFDSVDFKKKLEQANREIYTDFTREFSSAMNKVGDKAQNDLNFSKANMGLLYKAILFTQEDVRKRFDARLITLRSSGGILLATAATSKLIAKKVAAKGTAKVAAKVAGKAIVKTTVGVGGGAAAGATVGLVCGPFAWICSPVGAVVGGVTVWVATDKVVLEIDEHFNRKTFEAGIKKMIDKQKIWMKKQIDKNYVGIIRKIAQANSKGIKKLKNMSPAEDSAN